MEMFEFIKNKSTRVMIIWLSCFDKARTIEEVGKIWEYSSGKVLHLGNIPSKMLEYKLIRVEKIERKQIYFRSSFEIYFDILKNIVEEVNTNSVREFYQMFLKEPELYLKIIDSEEYRQIFLNVFSIKKLYNDNRDLAGNYNSALGVPLLGLIFLVFLKMFLKIRQPTEFGKMKIITCENFKMAWKFIFPIINIEDYMNDIKERLDKKTFDKLSENIEKTGFYNEYFKFGRMFISSFGSLLKE
ncbi:MAG: hypothetical protein QXT38_04300 [Candidatus Aenigmatarchaeota archaeon]